ncbi:MAG: phosphatidylserine/phosphatidylglycerophosphate/cardiolipin synthase family protein [Proteobacteria bacterium]|jgi:cardiolipin synthase|nr:phosphatidylserine/phosphatidylglycerophosphate/cardiolipin synthase family protein [Pseudomonadota bacterium]
MSINPWQNVRIYFEGDEYFETALAEIEKAQKQIYLETYIFDYDPIGIRFLQALTRAHQRGVKVHLLIDGVGSFNWLPQIQKFCAENQLPLRIHNPLPSQIARVAQKTWKRLRRALVFYRKLNRRNHRKTILIDEDKAFLGSLNITQIHSRKYTGDFAWRDTGVFIQGKEVQRLHEAFLQTWRASRHPFAVFLLKYLRRKLRQKSRSHSIRLNNSAVWRFDLLRDLNRRAKTAERRILITNAYFLPRRSVLKSLIKAAERGVYVGLILPSKSDVPLVQWASKSLYGRLLRSGVQIFEYEPSVLHAKTLIIDNWATVGSHNLNHRSFLHDLEVEAVFEDPAIIHQLLEQWDSDARASSSIQLEDLGKLVWWRRVLYRFAHWWRYWL